MISTLFLQEQREVLVLGLYGDHSPFINQLINPFKVNIMTLALSQVGPNINGWTAPTMTLSADIAPNSNGKQFAITAVSSMSGARAHSSTDPFTVTWFKVPSPSPSPRLASNGFLSSVGYNRFKRIIRKGTLPLAGQPAVVSVQSTEYKIAAGSDSADVANIAAIIALDGALGLANPATDTLTLLTKNILSF